MGMQALIDYCFFKHLFWKATFFYTTKRMLQHIGEILSSLRAVAYLDG